MIFYDLLDKETQFLTLEDKGVRFPVLNLLQLTTIAEHNQRVISDFRVSIIQRLSQRLDMRCILPDRIVKAILLFVRQAGRPIPVLAIAKYPTAVVLGFENEYTFLAYREKINFCKIAIRFGYIDISENVAVWEKLSDYIVRKTLALGTRVFVFASSSGGINNPVPKIKQMVELSIDFNFDTIK
jgi:hypothetical protein